MGKRIFKLSWYIIGLYSIIHFLMGLGFIITIFMGLVTSLDRISSSISLPNIIEVFKELALFFLSVNLLKYLCTDDNIKKIDFIKKVSYNSIILAIIDLAYQFTKIGFSLFSFESSFIYLILYFISWKYYINLNEQINLNMEGEDLSG